MRTVLLLVLLVVAAAAVAAGGRRSGGRSAGRSSVASRGPRRPRIPNNSTMTTTTSHSRSSRKPPKARRKASGTAATPSTSRKEAIVPTRRKGRRNTWRDGVEALAHGLLANAGAALATTGKVQRQLKTYFSSDYEQLLLRMTAPEDTKPDADDVERFVATIETFVRNLDVTSPSNPYRVTLRKLWTKAAEPDGRTTLKALYLLHTVLRSATPEDAVIFKTLLNKMVREPSKKPAGCRHFDLERVATVSAETAPLQDAIEVYAAYVFQRAKTFTSAFEEMRLIAAGMRTEDICAQLMKALKVLDSALACRALVDATAAGPWDGPDALLACLELVALDLRDLFRLFHAKLLWVLREEQRGDLFAGWEGAEVKAVLAHFQAFYNDRYEDAEAYLDAVAARVRRRFGTELNLALDPPAVFADSIPVYPRKQKSTAAPPSSSQPSPPLPPLHHQQQQPPRAAPLAAPRAEPQPVAMAAPAVATAGAWDTQEDGSGRSAFSTASSDLDEAAWRTDAALASVPSLPSDLGITEPDHDADADRGRYLFRPAAATAKEGEL